MSSVYFTAYPQLIAINEYSYIIFDHLLCILGISVYFDVIKWRLEQISVS